MSAWSRGIGAALVVVVSVGWLASVCWPAEGRPLFLPYPSVAERAIADALASPTQLDFQAPTPLQDVVDYLKRYHKIEIQIDTKALNDVGIQPGSQITKSLTGISLRSALNLMLRDLGLTYMIRDEVLLITTEEEAKSENSFFTRVYCLSELAGELAGSNKSRYDAEEIAKTIFEAIEPRTWDDVGGEGALTILKGGTGPVLVISQTQDVHEKIVDLLQSLRDVATMEAAISTERREAKAAAPKGARAAVGSRGGRVGRCRR